MFLLQIYHINVGTERIIKVSRLYSPIDVQNESFCKVMEATYNIWLKRVINTIQIDPEDLLGSPYFVQGHEGHNDIEIKEEKS